MDLIINLTDDQRLYLQSIYDYFHTEGKWPTHKYLERRFIQTHPDLDIEEVVQSMPTGLTNPISPEFADSEAILTIPAMYQCQGSRQDLAAFVSVIGLCVNRYFDPQDEKPQISSDDLSRYQNWKERPIRKVGLILKNEPNIWSVFYGPGEDGSWKCEIAKDIRRFRGVKTIEQYLEKRDIPRKVSSEPAIPTSKSSVIVTTVELQLHPDILSRCWGLYADGKYDDAILNATKALEVVIRTRANLSHNVIGIDVINTAFSLKKPLLRYSKVDAEQEGMMSLLRGMIQVFKNPQSHRFVGVQDKSECLSVLLMCSNLLYIIDNAEYIG